MKLLYLISHLGEEGPVHALLGIVRGNQSRWKDDITILTVSDVKRDVLAPEFKTLGATLLNLPVAKSPWRCVAAIRKLLRSGGFSAASSTGIKTDLLLALAARGLSRPKIFTTVQNVPSEDLGYLFPGVKGKFLALLHYRIIKAFKNHVIAVSKTVHFHLRDQRGIDSRLVMNPLGVQIREGSTTPDAIEKVIIYAASISERKNTPEAIEFVLRSDATADHRLDIYGDGPLSVSLKALYANYPLDKLRWMGFTRDLPAAFRSAAVYVSASRSEGLPLTPQVALLCGCPCVLSNIPQHSELAALSPFVFLYDPGKIQDFSRAMKSALQANRAHAITDAERLSAVVSPEAIATQLRELYSLSEIK